MKIKDFHPSLIGLFQALGAIIYCALISGLFRLMDELAVKPPEFMIAMIMLFLLVVSAAISGLLVFGYPLYLVLQGKTKEGLIILAYTFLYSVIILILGLTCAIHFG